MADKIDWGSFEPIDSPKSAAVDWDSFEEVKEEKPSAMRRVADVGISALKGAIGIPEAVLGLADLVSGGQAGKSAESMGLRTREAKEFLNEYLSPQQQEANRKVEEAKGFMGTAEAAIRNPSTILQTAVESAPSMLAGGVAARGIGAATKIAPYLAGAAGEGLVAAGSSAEQIRQQSKDGLLTAGQAGSALASGVGTAAFGAAGGKIAQRLGIADVDTMLAAGGGGMTSKSVARRLIEGGIAEGVFEELPQSVQEQVWQNAALNKPLLEGVPEQAAMGLLTGAAMGGGSSALINGKPVTPIDEAAPAIEQPVGEQGPIDFEATPVPAASPLALAEEAAQFGNEIEFTPSQSVEEILSARLEEQIAGSVANIASAGSVDEAIAAAQQAASAPTPSEALLKITQGEQAYKILELEQAQERQQQFDLAEQARRDADAALMVEQQRAQEVEQAEALTAAQGFDVVEPSAMQLAMQRAKGKSDAAKQQEDAVRNKALADELASLSDSELQDVIARRDTISKEQEFAGMLKSEQSDLAYLRQQSLESQRRTREFALAEQARREAAIPGMERQKGEQEAEIAQAVTRAQGFDDPQQTALQIAMQAAQERRKLLTTPVSKREQIVEPAPAVQSAEPVTQTQEVANVELPNISESGVRGDGRVGVADAAPQSSDQQGVSAGSVQPVESGTAVAAGVQPAAGVDVPSPDATADTKRALDTEIAEAKKVLIAAKVVGKERLDLLTQVKAGTLSAQEVKEAYAEVAAPAPAPIVAAPVTEPVAAPVAEALPTKPGWEEKVAKQDAALQAQIATANANTAERAAAKAQPEVSRYTSRQTTADGGFKSGTGMTELNAKQFATELDKVNPGVKHTPVERDNGMFDVVGRKAPAVKKSTAAPVANAESVETIRPALDKALKRYGSGFAQTMLDTGKVKIVDSTEAADVLGNEPEGPAFFDPKTGITHIVADRISKNATPEQVHGLVLHEVANHALQMGKSTPEFKKLLSNLETMRKAGSKQVRAAFAQAEKAGTSPELMAEETLGYLLQSNPELSLSQRVVSWIRGAMRAIGNKLPPVKRAEWFKSIDQMSVEDLTRAAQDVLKGSPAALNTQTATEDQEVRFAKAGQTDTPAFKRWFGDSKVVDENGSPLVVYHGTKKDIAEFKLPEGDNVTPGFFFTPNSEYAGAYAGSKEGANVTPVYLSIANPKRIENWDSYLDADLRAKLEAKGHDGIIAPKVENGMDLTQYVAFRPEQIKSTIGNNGEFDPAKADIRYTKSVRTQTEWIASEPSRLDDFLYLVQDKQIDTKRVVETINKISGKIQDELDPRLQETLFSGRSAKQTQDFAVKELKPLYVEMQARGVTIDELEKYLHARHAESRNKRMAKINPTVPNLQDGASGMKTGDADKYLKALTPTKRKAYDALAKRVDSILKETQKLLVESGLEKQSTIDTWNATYDHYVPLHRADMEGSPGIGQGFSVRGSSSKRAMGSEREVIDILANVALQRERAIVRAEKNKVAMATYGLAIDQPNKEFWLPINPNNNDRMTAKQMQSMQDELVSLGLDPADVQSIMKEPKQRYVDQRTGLVAERVNPVLRSAPNVMALRVNGEDRFLFFSEKDPRATRMVTALKNLDADQLGIVLGASAVASRWFAAVNTQYNPIFGITNVARDIQAAMMNLSTTDIAGKQKEVLGYTMSAMRGIYSDVRAKRAGRPSNSQWAQLFEELQKEGGTTGFRDMFTDSGDRARKLQSEIDQITEGKAKAAGRAIFGWLSDYNETLENAVRLAAYKVGTEQGMTKQRAAAMAKELTVNFNRKGTMALQAGALYAFFNASVQGTARLVETLSGPAGKKIVAGGLLLGTMQALMMSAAGFGEDEPPEFVKERNIIIPLKPLTGGGDYIAIPMPLGFHVIPSFSRNVTEWAMSGGKNTTKRIANIFGMLASSFNPIGSAGASIQSIAPTPVDPLVALSENRDFTGKPIAREDMSGLRQTPGYTRAKDTAGYLSKTLSYYLNLASGGTKHQAGVFSPTPDQIEYLVGQVTGGVGRELMKTEQAVTSLVTGEDLPPNKIPGLGKFYGDTKGQSSEAAKFYANIKRLNGHDLEIKGRRKEGENVAEYIRENKDATLAGLGTRTQTEIGELNRMKRKLIERGANKERVKLIELQIAGKMKRLNDRVETMREKSEEAR